MLLDRHDSFTSELLARCPVYYKYTIHHLRNRLPRPRCGTAFASMWLLRQLEDVQIACDGLDGPRGCELIRLPASTSVRPHRVCKSALAWRIRLGLVPRPTDRTRGHFTPSSHQLSAHKCSAHNSLCGALSFARPPRCMEICGRFAAEPREQCTNQSAIRPKIRNTSTTHRCTHCCGGTQLTEFSTDACKTYGQPLSAAGRLERQTSRSTPGQSVE